LAAAEAQPLKDPALDLDRAEKPESAAPVTVPASPETQRRAEADPAQPDDTFELVEPAPADGAAGFATDTPEPAEMSDPLVAGSVAIWQPFRSAMSAEGFARRLTAQLGYPFYVNRNGPADYRVQFDYDSDAQRALLQRQVVELTGAKGL
jgi:hypothetical protein